MTTLFALASVLAASDTALAAEASPWTRSHRYYLEANVELPTFMWFATAFNQQARVTAFEVRLVTRCDPMGLERANVYELACAIEDVSLSARGMPQEAGLLQPILEELDLALSDSTVQLRVHADGHLRNIDLEDAMFRRNRRVGRINETLRLVLARAFAGFDVALPSGEEQWVQYSSWLMRAPASIGSTGGVELVNRVVERSGEFVRVQSVGKGLIVPGEGVDRFDARLVSEAWIDPSGKVTDREWTVLAAPTASSFIASGTEGYPYIQRGKLSALSATDTREVGESLELPPAAGPSALQQYDSGGLTPGL